MHTLFQKKFCASAILDIGLFSYHADLKLVSVDGSEVLQQIKQYCDQIDGVTQCDVIILKWLL